MWQSECHQGPRRDDLQESRGESHIPCAGLPDVRHLTVIGYISVRAALEVSLRVVVVLYVRLAVWVSIRTAVGSVLPGRSWGIRLGHSFDFRSWRN